MMTAEERLATLLQFKDIIESAVLKYLDELQRTELRKLFIQAELVGHNTAEWVTNRRPFVDIVQ